MTQSTFRGDTMMKIKKLEKEIAESIDSPKDKTINAKSANLFISKFKPIAYGFVLPMKTLKQ